MKLTDKQKNFILDNIELLDEYDLHEIIEKLIDNMSKEHANQLISKMIEALKEVDATDIDIY